MSVTATIITRNPSTQDLTNINLSYLNPVLFPETGNIPEQSYRILDEAARAIVAISNNTYVDTLLNRSESTTEKISG